MSLETQYISAATAGRIELKQTDEGGKWQKSTSPKSPVQTRFPELRQKFQSVLHARRSLPPQLGLTSILSGGHARSTSIRWFAQIL